MVYLKYTQRILGYKFYFLAGEEASTSFVTNCLNIGMFDGVCWSSLFTKGNCLSGSLILNGGGGKTVSLIN